MNLLDHITSSGRQYKKASTEKGGEYHGPCPKCGGTDRFHIWPNQSDHGTFWCRICGQAGDAIEYLMKFDGLTFPDACKAVGKDLPEHEDYQAPRFRAPAADTFTPRETTVPADLWIQHAEKLVNWAHDQLLKNPDQLAWLAARGLDLAAVKRYRLGWNPGEKGKDLYRVRESWGLSTVYKDDGTTKKKLWIPVGLVIPMFSADFRLQRIRIRRPEGEPRYYLVPGSGTSPMILGAESRAFVIVESELDAMLIHHLAGDLAGAISQGNSTAKPDSASQACLEKSLAILVALDSDQAGMQASVWWKKHYSQAERWPVPVGKDPGDAFKAGVNIREWVKAGLPPALTLPESPVTASSQDNSGAVSTVLPRECEQLPDVVITRSPVYTITAKDGRQVHITDDIAAYARLAEEGKIVFDSKELALVKLSGADQDQAARFLDAKQIFPGIRVESVRPDTGAGHVAENQPRYHGKYKRVLS